MLAVENTLIIFSNTLLSLLPFVFQVRNSLRKLYEPALAAALLGRLIYNAIKYLHMHCFFKPPL